MISFYGIGSSRVPLFSTKPIYGASGSKLPWKIECDALADEDWLWAAHRIAERVEFSTVEGVPKGGLKLAKALEPLCTKGLLLVVDDVYTTGGSIYTHRAGREAIGYVLFSRALKMPFWVGALWQLHP